MNNEKNNKKLQTRRDILQIGPLNTPTGYPEPEIETKPEPKPKTVLNKIGSSIKKYIPFFLCILTILKSFFRRKKDLTNTTNMEL
jgi:hypothetical protein